MALEQVASIPCSEVLPTVPETPGALATSPFPPAHPGSLQLRAPDLAAVSVVYIAIGAAAIWLLDRLVGLEIFLRSR